MVFFFITFLIEEVILVENHFILFFSCAQKIRIISVAVADRCTDFSTIDLAFSLLIRLIQIDSLHLHLSNISLLISFSQVLNILVKSFIHLLIVALDSGVLTIHKMLTSVSNGSYRALNLVLIIVTVIIDINFIALLWISRLSKVTATFLAA